MNFLLSCLLAVCTQLNAIVTIVITTIAAQNNLFGFVNKYLKLKICLDDCFSIILNIFTMIYGTQMYVTLVYITLTATSAAVQMPQ